MSPLNTLAGGYKGGSPRVRSENIPSDFEGAKPSEIDANELGNKIRMWYEDGNLSKEGAQILLNILNEIVA